MPVKMKIFIIAMAVMCLMTCMCVTAFAAEAPPSGYVAVSPGEVVNPNYAQPHKYVFPAYDGVEYTITGMGRFAKLFGVTESGDIVQLDVTFSDNAPLVYVADGSYPWICFDSGVANVLQVSVTWKEPTFWGQAGMFVTGVMDNFGGPVLSFISSHALVLIPALAGLCILGILVVRRFVYGA